MITYRPYGVTIGGKHSYYDFGLVMTKKFISRPEPKTNYIEVPGSSDLIDLSEAVSGHVEYKPRTIQLEFRASIEGIYQATRYSEILQYWNSSKERIVFDDDVAFFWIGRATAELSNNGRDVTVTVEAIVEPYKMDDLSTGEEWLWDPFDFDNDYVPEDVRIDINGIYTFRLLGRDKRTYPTITSSAYMTVWHNGNAYQVVPGINKMYEIIINKGEDTLIFDGVGTISVDYRGGML